jgi:hypothetical protein
VSAGTLTVGKSGSKAEVFLIEKAIGTAKKRRAKK